MTNGEKMIWSAVYAHKLCTNCFDVTCAVGTAAAAVRILKNYNNALRDTEKQEHPEVFKYIQEILDR